MANNLQELVKKNKKYVREGVDLNEMLDKFLQGEQQTSQKRHSAFFHPSLVSKGIDCQVWWFYFLKGMDSEPDRWSDENITAMVNGTAIHNEWQHVFYRMGILEGVWKCISCGHKFWALSPKDICPSCNQVFKSWNYLKFKEVPIHFGMIRGHADGLINMNGTRFLLELKSIKNVDRPNAVYGFEKLGNNPLEDHLMQAQLYMNCWNEISKLAALEEEVVIDDTGRLSSVKLEGPIYDGAKIIGPINNGIIEYIAKNSSEKRAYLIKRNKSMIQFLMDEMAYIWKSYLEDDISILTGYSGSSKNKCQKCIYRISCGRS